MKALLRCAQIRYRNVQTVKIRPIASVYELTTPPNRLRRAFGERGSAIIVPLDDSLISGPKAGLEDMATLARQIASSPACAVLGFSGQFARYGDLMSRADLAWIVNLTASTIGSRHTRKVRVGSVEHAVRVGGDAVAVHINMTSQHESEMLGAAGEIFEEAQRLGVPSLAIVYPRSEKPSGGDENYDDMRECEPAIYEELLKRCVRMGFDLGANAVKTQYTGSEESFRRVCQTEPGRPIFIAGGPKAERTTMIEVAADAVRSGAHGVSFGRNVFQRKAPSQFLEDLMNKMSEARQSQ
jgi:DhnA family fructose-bisphosphate aldolase class Ia